jgi:hypothetical protein
MREIIWTKHGENAFNEISERVKTRKSQELFDIGIDDVYELHINPWKIYYKIINDNKIISIQQIIDTRRNIEELLVNLIIEKKI